MPISQVPGQSDIMDELKTIPGVDVYEGQYLTDGAIPNMDAQGMFTPYLTTIFGANYRGAEPGIVSEQYNTLKTTVTVYVVSPGDKLTRVLLDQVNEKMLGFIPTDGTPLEAYGGYNFVDADLGANRYVHAAVYSYTSNMGYML